MQHNNLTIQGARKGLISREFSAEELTRSCLSAIEERDGDIHAFLDVWPDEALEAARAADAVIAAGDPLAPLAGIPMAIKDNICVRGRRATAGSRILEHYVAPYDATVIARLRQAGAALMGKTNMDEFAMGASTEHSAFGPTHNPHDLERVPGGSSGGSAAAVAAGMCLAALGSDTGGSIRQPASFCGVVGFKPTYGAVSRHGLIALGSSLDQIGPLARSAQDAAVVFDVIAGKDPLDSTTVEVPPTPEEAGHSWKGVRVGIPKEYAGEGMDPAVEAAVAHGVRRMQELGARVEDISLPHTRFALAAYYVILPSEVSANLARYDNIRYDGLEAGPSVNGDGDLADWYRRARSRGFGDEPRRRIMLGTFALSSGYYEAYYGRAQRVRALIRQDFVRAFESVDIVVTPASPTPAFRLGEKTDDPLKMYLSDVFTVTANLAGIPGISLPLPVEGLPVGLQLLSTWGSDRYCLNIARALEEAWATS